MWDNFPILFFTKGRIKYEARENFVNIYINEKCVFKIIKAKGNLNEVRGYRCPLAIIDDSIDLENIEYSIKPISGSIFKYGEQE